MIFGKTSQGIAEHDLCAKNCTTFSLWLQIVKMQGHFVQKYNMNINEEKLSVSARHFFKPIVSPFGKNGKQNLGLVNFAPESHLLVVQIDLFIWYVFFSQ